MNEEHTTPYTDKPNFDLDVEVFRDAIPPYNGNSASEFNDYLRHNLCCVESANKFIDRNESSGVFNEDIGDLLWLRFALRE